MELFLDYTMETVKDRPVLSCGEVKAPRGFLQADQSGAAEKVRPNNLPIFSTQASHRQKTDSFAKAQQASVRGR
jgi:hypothetical protein